MIAARPIGSLCHPDQAPHRLLFFSGACNLLLAMLWWCVWLLAQQWAPPLLPRLELHAGWLHAQVMQYQLLPSFVFGFLLTEVPRWAGQPEVSRWHHAPVGIGLCGGQLLTLVGACGVSGALPAGWGFTVAGWCFGLCTLGRVLWHERGQTWHAYSCMAALAMGLTGLLAHGVALLGGSPIWVFISIKLGSFGLLLPLFLTLAHRMLASPATSVVSGAVTWCPLWLLLPLWALSLAHLGLELRHAYQWLWLADLPLMALVTFLCWRWWPRGPQPARLTVLHCGLAWLPLTLLMYTVQSLGYALTQVYGLGRAPAHALFIGFFGSVLLAMVTRLTLGHSGRALVWPRRTTWAFALIQVCAVVRIAGELGSDPLLWHLLAALLWLLALGPWVWWLARVLLRPRIGGRPG